MRLNTSTFKSTQVKSVPTAEMNSGDILTNNNNTGSGVVFSISMMHRVVSGAEPGYILENLTAALGPAGGGSIFTGEDD